MQLSISITLLRVAVHVAFIWKFLPPSKMGRSQILPRLAARVQYRAGNLGFAVFSIVL